jgi:hypothetical protein
MDTTPLEQRIWQRRAAQLSEELERHVTEEEAVKIYNERINNAQPMVSALGEVILDMAVKAATDEKYKARIDIVDRMTGVVIDKQIVPILAESTKDASKKIRSLKEGEFPGSRIDIRWCLKDTN